jgi:two-component system response regulator RegA
MPSALNRSASAEVAGNVCTWLGARNVLLIDVDCSARRQLAGEFTTLGFDVSASDAADDGAFSLASRLRPTLVVLELRLGVGSGLDLLARLRPELPAAKFVVLTSYGSVASAVRALRLGATNYLCKPARAREVLWAANESLAVDLPASQGPAAGDGLTLDQAIWEYIHHTIEISGSLSEAARRLGLWRQSLKRMITKHRPSDARSGMRPAGIARATARR